jgi:hypothetical protein
MIKCLGEECDVPEKMKFHDTAQKGEKAQRKARIRQGTVNPARGIVLIVQPTDFNEEYRPPGPSLGTVEALQKLVARATVEEIPTVLLSPRFATMEMGWEQSGYQQSSSYGGVEPPRGPTPWVMRDFTPPVFSWIGRAIELPASDVYTYTDERGYHCRYLGISLYQSFMQEGHSWHLFAVKRRSSSSNLEYEYIASTKSSAGRPTRELLLRVFSEFASYQ